jgi:hypothetical protein
MSLQSTDLLYVQRPSGGDAGNYKMNAGELLDFVADSPAIVYRGTVDCTLPVGSQLDPNPPVQGDMYINTGTGTVDASGSTSADQWVGITGDSISDGQRILFDGTSWAILGQEAGGGVQTVTGTAPITVTGTTEDVVVGIDEATNAAYGSTRLAQDPPNAGDLVSTADTDVLSVPHFNELAGRISTAAAGGIQAVTGIDPIDVSTDGITHESEVSIKDASTIQKGAVILTDAVATDSTKAVTGTAVENYAVPLNLSGLAALP